MRDRADRLSGTRPRRQALTAGARRLVTGQPNPPAARGDRTRQRLLSRRFGEHDLSMLRRMVSRLAVAVGLPESRRGDLILAVDEIASNALRHGGGHGRLELWTAAGKVWFQVTDDGPGLPNGTVPALPEPSRADGRGLWIASTVTDTLTLTSSRTGTIVTGAVALASA